MQFSQWEHVRIRPSIVLTDELGPIARVVELLFEQFPVVPKIVGDAPHLRVFLKKLGFRNWGWPRRDAQDDWSTRFTNRKRKSLHLSWLIKMAAHVVGLDEIHAPRGVQLRKGIVVGLRAGLCGIHAPHVRVPAAGVVFVYDVGSTVLRAFNWCVLFDRLPGNSTHNVNAEFQAFAVNVLRKMREA